MKVKDLIEELKKHDPERLVVMSSDAEGNSYSPLADVGTGAYVEENPWSGEVYLEKLTDKLKERGLTEEDVWAGDSVPALVLSPTN